MYYNIFATIIAFFSILTENILLNSMQTKKRSVIFLFIGLISAILAQDLRHPSSNQEVSRNLQYVAVFFFFSWLVVFNC